MPDERVVNDKEFAAVIALPPPKRYTHFIKQVVDWEQIWSLRSADGWVLAGDDEGRELVPVWPHARYAAACAQEAWQGSKPEAITLAEWMEYWLPGMQRDGRLVAVFPAPSNTGIVVTPERLHADLSEESELYE
jgi:hypothetical protein